MSDKTESPWWLALVPDIRGWATIGMFVLVFYVLTLIAFVPGVGENELFKTVATLLLGSGAFGLVCAFLWGGSKASNAAADTVNAVAKAAATPTPGTTTTTVTPAKPAPVSDMTVTADTVNVEQKS